MPDDSAGTVTFLFTDIEGSTRLLRRLRERYEQVLTEHQRLLRAAFTRHGGDEIDTQGDSFFVVFRRAKDAVSAAVEAQRALESHTWPEGLELRVRMGVHTGEAVQAEGRYLGLAVHRAARICAAAHGGQILVSDITRSLLEDEEAELSGVTLRDLGQKTLKDFDRPIHLHDVVAPGLRQSFPDIAIGEAPFAGREDELAEAAQQAVVSPRWPRRGTALVALVVILVFGVPATIGSIALLRDDDGGRTGASIGAPAVKPDSLVRIDPGTRRIASVIKAGNGPGAVVFEDGFIWALNEFDRTITRVNAETEEVGTIPAELDRPCCLAAERGGGVWVSGYGNRELKRLTAGASQPDRVLRLGVSVHGTATGRTAVLSTLTAVGDSSLWVLHPGAARVRRVDVRTGRVLTDKRVDDRPYGVAYGRGSAWVASYGGDSVTEIRSSDNALSVLSVPGGPVSVAVAKDALWVGSFSDQRLRRIDRASRTITDIVPTGGGPAHAVRLFDVAVGFGGIWVTMGVGAILRVDPDDPSRIERIELGHRAGGIAVGAGAVWVTVQEPLG